MKFVRDRRDSEKSSPLPWHANIAKFDLAKLTGETSMVAVSRSTVSFASAILVKAKRLFLCAIRAMMEARMRRIQYELQFRRSFDAYREGKGIPPLGENLRSGS
jgi:hypothetical protein